MEYRGAEPNRPHSYEVTEIKLVDSNTTNQSLEPTAPHKAPSIGVANLLQGVEKSYDLGKKKIMRLMALMLAAIMCTQ